MPLEVLGNKVSIMHKGARQMKYVNKMKHPGKAKRLVVFKRTSIPSPTPYIVKQWLRLATLARETRGKNYDEVMNHIFRNIDRISGPVKPEAVKKAEKIQRYKRADANIAWMKEYLREHPVEETTGPSLEELETRAAKGLGTMFGSI